MSYRPFDLSGRVALVTGGNAGIGLGIAEGLAQAGADICIWGTNEARNAEAAERLRAHGRRVAALRCDVSNKAEVERSFAATLEQLGRVDGCFANAGVMSVQKPFHEMSEADLDRTFGVNLKGAFFTMQCAAQHMKQRAEAGDAFGRLVATSSLSAVSGLARGEDYAATKGAMLSTMRGLCVEYARYGVTANSIVPGWIETAMTGPLLENPKFVTAVTARIPQRRFGKPEDFAGIAVYLMSTASAHHTGDCFTIDGGYHNF